MHLIPKPLGNDRPVSVLAVLVRLWENILLPGPEYGPVVAMDIVSAAGFGNMLRAYVYDLAIQFCHSKAELRAQEAAVATKVANLPDGLYLDASLGRVARARCTPGVRGWGRKSM